MLSLRCLGQIRRLQQRHHYRSLFSCLRQSSVASRSPVVLNNSNLCFANLHLQRQHAIFFSSTPTTPNDTEDVDPQRIQELLCQKSIPIGSLDSEVASEIKSTVRKLTTEGSLESFQMAFHLMDRLAQEVQFAVHKKTNDGNTEELMCPRILLDMIKAWRKHRKAFSSTQWLSPRRLFEKLKNWERIDSDTTIQFSYSMLIYEAGKLRNPELAEDILKHLRTASASDSRLHPDVVSHNRVMHAWLRVDRKDSLQRAESIFQQMIRLCDAGRRESAPNLVSCRLIVSAWADRAPEYFVQRTEKLMAAIQQRGLLTDESMRSMVLTEFARLNVSDAAYSRMKQTMSRFEMGGNDSKQDAYSFRAVLTSLINRGDVHRADQVLVEQSQQFRIRGDQEFLPRAPYFNQVISLWSKSGDSEAPQRAEALLQLMQDLAELSKNRTLRPDDVHFTMVLSAWAHSKHEIAPSRCEQILLKMQQLYDDGLADCQPSTFSFNVVLSCWAKSSRKEAPERAEAILRHMMLLYEAGNLKVKPDKFTYTTVMNAWSRAGLPQSGHRAQALFDEMLQKYSAGDLEVKPSGTSYGTLISAWASIKRKDGAASAQSIFDEMVSRYENGDKDLKPDIVKYNALIDAWAKAGEPERAEQILRQLESNASNEVKPDLRAYNAVMNAWSRSGSPAAGARAQAWFDELMRKYEEGNHHLKPDHTTFGTLIHAWSNEQVRDGALHAQKTLDNMISYGIKPNIRHYNMLIGAWGERCDAEMAEKVLRSFESKSTATVKPDILTYTIVIRAWTRSKHPQAAEHAKRLFDELMGKYRAGDSGLKPTKRAFTTVLEAFALRKDGAPQVASIINEMLVCYRDGNAEVKPDAHHIGVLIKAWAQAGNPGKAEELFRAMESDSLNGLIPSTMSYTALIYAWIESSMPDGLKRAQLLYDEMVQKQLAGQGNLRLDGPVYSALIKAWCLQPDGTIKAQALLDDMVAQRNAGVTDLDRWVEPLRALIDTAAAKAKALNLRLFFEKSMVK